MESLNDLDLNIDNYSLEDILNLFNLNLIYTKEDLKNAKKKALKTHPDKSGLERSVFIFFSKAYNILSKLYKLKNRTEKKVENIDYDENDMEESQGNKELLQMKLKNLDKKNFNTWFNKLFEKSNGKLNANGHGDWLKSSEGLSDLKASNKSEFDEIFKNKKRESRELIIKKDIQDIVMNNGCSMLDNNETIYSSDIFSKLQYDDVKKVHMETVIPVTEQDFTEKKRFDNVEQYIRHRKSDEGNIPTLSYSKKQLNKNQNSSEIMNTKRAYNLLMEDNEMKMKNNMWWKNLKLLT
uniref:J domain-containing protein n=1 Tax=viral metagenome TaxID=1070528 RepID=A0A6C0LZX3_9ZZZZ